MPGEINRLEFVKKAALVAATAAFDKLQGKEETVTVKTPYFPMVGTPRAEMVVDDQTGNRIVMTPDEVAIFWSQYNNEITKLEETTPKAFTSPALGSKLLSAIVDAPPLKDMSNPTAEDLEDPLFNALYDATKHWDVNVPGSYVGYCGLNGSHVKVMLDAIRPEVARQRIGGFAKAIQMLDMDINAEPGNVGELFFEAAKHLMRFAEENGVIIKMNMPTANEVDMYKTRSSVTVTTNAAPDKVYITPIDGPYGNMNHGNG